MTDGQNSQKISVDITDAVAVESSFNQYNMLYGWWFYGYLHAKLGNVLNNEKLCLCQKAWRINNSRFSPVMWSKLKIVTVQWIKSRIWDTIDNWYINNITKNQVFAVFHSRVICKSVSPKFRELCMETPCLWPSEGHKYGGRKVAETSVSEFCYRNEKLLL